MRRCIGQQESQTDGNFNDSQYAETKARVHGNTCYELLFKYCKYIPVYHIHQTDILLLALQRPAQIESVTNEVYKYIEE